MWGIGLGGKPQGLNFWALVSDVQQTRIAGFAVAVGRCGRIAPSSQAAKVRFRRPQVRCWRHGVIAVGIVLWMALAGLQRVASRAGFQ